MGNTIKTDQEYYQLHQKCNKDNCKYCKTQEKSCCQDCADCCISPDCGIMCLSLAVCLR